MPGIHVANPWGRIAQSALPSMDAQRADLWQIDLHSVVSNIHDQLVATAQGFGLVQNLPSDSEALYYVQSMDLPELRMETPTMMRDALPYLVPGVDNAPTPMRLTFLVDAGVLTPDLGSKLLSFLFAWRALSRVGRGSFDGGFVDQSDYEVALGLNDISPGTLQPVYRFDVPVNLLRGATLQAIVDGDPLEVAGTLKIRQMWLVGLQPAALQYSGGAAIWTLAASFACSGWLPVPVAALI